MELVGDKDLNVRCAATKSLNSITMNHSSLVKANLNLNENFWKSLKNNLALDESLIIEVDYGISKEKKDLGRPLRLESFNLLKLLIKFVAIESHLIDEMILIALTNISTF